jgi:hypothetical protein
MIVSMGLFLLGMLIVGIPLTVFCFNYKAKKKLSPSDYDIAMTTIENIRAEAIEKCKTEKEIKEVNDYSDYMASQYKISRRLT